MSEITAATAADVADYLRSLPSARDVRPVSVKLGTVVYYGARYTTISRYEADMVACTVQGVKPGTEYTEDCIYLAGMRPMRFRRRNYFCFPFDGFDWYISCYYDKKQPDQHHPFGPMFTLHPWDMPDGSKIDTGEVHAYPRINMEVIALDNKPEITDEYNPGLILP